MKKNTFISTIIFNLCAVLFFCIVLSCKKERTIINLPLSGPDQNFYVLADNNTLIGYNAKNIKTSSSKVTITGIGNTEKLLSIDFRPATGDLYAISDASKLYIINITTGAARAISKAPFTPAISGTTVSMDFNPTLDKIRLVTNTGQNLNINPETGTVATVDANISGGTIMGIAYTNSVAGATTTDLYDIDPIAKVLYKQDPPNNGTLVKVFDLGRDIGDKVSLDISPNNKNILMASKLNDTLKLFSIDLEKKTTKLSGIFLNVSSIQGIAIPVDPAAYAISLDASNVSSLLTFNPTVKTTIVSKAITGLQTGETILGLDMRPSNGQAYALGSSNRLYTINLATAELTQVGTGTFSTALTGTSFGFDFSPQDELIRVVSNTRQNLSINPETAVTTPNTDLRITGGSPTVSAAAYSSNFTGTTTAPKLYVIDHTTNKLYTQEPVLGTLTEVGALKIVITAANGFDIGLSNIGDAAYGIFNVEGANKLYRVDLSTGAAGLQFDQTFPQTITGFTLGRKL